MPMAKRKSAYEIEKRVMDTVLSRGEPMKYAMASEKAALRFRQTCYYFRTLCANDGDAQYERLIISAKGKNVHFDFKRATGDLMTEGGEKVPLVIRPTDEQQAVAKLVNNLDEFIEDAKIDLSILEDDNGDK